jgi:hypothetical protein
VAGIGEVDKGGTRQQEGMYSRQSHANVGSAKPPQDKYDRFEGWLKENGAQFDLVSYLKSSRGILTHFARDLSTRHDRTTTYYWFL